MSRRTCVVLFVRVFHTHTLTHTHTHTYTHTHYTRAHTHTHTHTLTHTHAHTHTHYTRAHTHTQHEHTRTRTHTHTNAARARAPAFCRYNTPRAPPRKVSDDELRTLAPLVILRDVLPQKLAAKLTSQLMADGPSWRRGKWCVRRARARALHPHPRAHIYI